MTDSFRRLAWTTGAVVAALLPHLGHLHAWVTALVLVVCAWRLLAERRGWPLPGPWLRGFAALAATAGVLASYRTITGLDGGTALLALMAALKLLETRTARDHVVLVFLGWFLCLAAFLYTQDLWTLALVLPTVWLLAAALLVVSRSGHGGPPLAPFRTTGAMLLKALPIALVLFLFFPRVAGQFWGAPSAERATSGLSDEISPGDVSELTLNDVVAFRVRFEGRLPPPQLRYWRGLVLSEFDGYTWSRGRSQSYFLPQVELLGAPVSYTVTLEPTGQRMLFALELPAAWPRDLAAQSWDFHLRSHRPINTVLQYRASSHLDYRAGVELSAALRNRNLQLPDARNRRTLELATRMRADAPDDANYAESVLRMFREQEFYYTLTPRGLARDSVDDFLFNSREGFCEHFASSFTMLMRAAGIPARVVAGFQGGDWNPLGGYLIVRNSHAHAWSEIWLEGRGWTRVDPTAAVAPERIERSLQAALGEAEDVPGRLVSESELLWQATMLWDSFNARWNDWVVQFDRLSQERLLESFGFDEPDWRDLALLLGTGLAGALLLLSGWLAWEFRPRTGDPALAAYRRWTDRLARAGIERAGHESPRIFAERVRRLRPDLGPTAQVITEIYLRLRYLPAPAPTDLALLRGLVRRFRP